MHEWTRMLTLALGWLAIGTAARTALAEPDAAPAHSAPMRPTKMTDAAERATITNALASAASLRASLKHEPTHRAAAIALEQGASLDQLTAIDRAGKLIKAAIEHAATQQRPVVIDDALKGRLATQIRAIGSHDAATIATATLESAAKLFEQDVKTAVTSFASQIGAKAALRESISALHALIGSWATARPPVRFVWHDVDGREHVASLQNRSQIEGLLASLEGKLQSLTDKNALAQIDLQTQMQKQAQMMQLLSSASKILHDTAMGVIDNMR